MKEKSKNFRDQRPPTRYAAMTGHMQAAIQVAQIARDQILDAMQFKESTSDDGDSASDSGPIQHLRNAVAAVNRMQHELIGLGDNLTIWGLDGLPIRVKLSQYAIHSDEDRD